MPRIPNKTVSPICSIWIGIDPGASGGVASLRSFLDGSGVMSTTYNVRETERDRLDLLREIVNREGPLDVRAVIEQVGGFIKGNPAPGSAMFNFGMNYGGWRMALIALGIPFRAIRPQEWQKVLGIPPRKKKPDESKTAFKNRLKARAQELFPAQIVTLATCDALLLAEYCRRTSL